MKALLTIDIHLMNRSAIDKAMMIVKRVGETLYNKQHSHYKKLFGAYNVLYISHIATLWFKEEDIHGQKIKNPEQKLVKRTLNNAQ